jgi:hypothetical protein
VVAEGVAGSYLKVISTAWTNARRDGPCSSP